MTKQEKQEIAVILAIIVFSPFVLGFAAIGYGIFAVREVILGLRDGFQDLRKNWREPIIL